MDRAERTGGERLGEAGQGRGEHVVVLHARAMPPDVGHELLGLRKGRLPAVKAHGARLRVAIEQRDVVHDDEMSDDPRTSTDHSSPSTTAFCTLSPFSSRPRLVLACVA